jgi:prenyltransferase beta subunit
VATFLFALAFGPELARVLARTRARMSVSWAPLADASPSGSEAGPPAGPLAGISAGLPLGALLAFAITAALGTATLLGSSRAVAASGSRDAHRLRARASERFAAELSYLYSAQDSNGGFGPARGESAGELYTAWAAIGLAAAGRDPVDVRHDGRSVLEGLRAEASTLEGLGDVERTILALRAAGASAYSFDRRDLVAEVLSQRTSDHSFAGQVNLTAFAIFALRAVGHSASFAPISEAAGWIERQQNPDGGFSFSERGSSSDVDDTAAAVQALVDAGFPQQPGGESNAQSTAWATQALIALGRNPASVRRHGSRSPVGYLESLVSPGGSVRYSRTSAQTPVWVTAQALVALAGRTFPVVG